MAVRRRCRGEWFTDSRRRAPRHAPGVVPSWIEPLNKTSFIRTIRAIFQPILYGSIQPVLLTSQVVIAVAALVATRVRSKTFQPWPK
jgi:hypothetical protein